jgi:uncharacterized protein GlcG (DUF336 family)
MAETRQHLTLTYDGAAKVLAAAVRKAAEMGAPQCIAVTDDGGHLLAFGRTDGGKVLSTWRSRRPAWRRSRVRRTGRASRGSG